MAKAYSYQTRPPVGHDDRKSIAPNRQVAKGEVRYWFNTGPHLERSRTAGILLNDADLIEDLIALCGGPKAAIRSILSYAGDWNS